jgi:hypothetical protein
MPSERCRLSVSWPELPDEVALARSRAVPLRTRTTANSGLDEQRMYQLIEQ